MKNSLLNKLTSKWNKVKKPLAGITLALTMLTAPLTACDEVDLNSLPTDLPDISTPITSGDSTMGGITGDSADVSVNNSYFNSYSKTLQTVLTGSYYSTVIAYEEARFFKDDKIYHTSADNYCENVPYGFLEEQGYDVDQIKKSDNNAVTSEVYIYDDEPNNLYIKCAVLNNSTIDYYDTYLLKYQLTNTELNDLNRLFDMKASGFVQFKNAMYQAPFFIQELSYQKGAQVLAHSYMEAKTFQWFKNNLSTSDLVSNVYTNYDLSQSFEGSGLFPMYLNSSIEAKKNNKWQFYYHNLSFVPHNVSTEKDDHLKGKGLIYENISCLASDLISNGSFVKIIDNNDVLSFSSINLTYMFYYDNDPPVDNTQAQSRSATFYTVHNSYMLNGLDSNENVSYVNDSSWLYKEMTTDSGNKVEKNIEK